MNKDDLENFLGSMEKEEAIRKYDKFYSCDKNRKSYERDESRLKSIQQSLELKEMIRKSRENNIVEKIRQEVDIIIANIQKDISDIKENNKQNVEAINRMFVKYSKKIEDMQIAQEQMQCDINLVKKLFVDQTAKNTQNVQQNNALHNQHELSEYLEVLLSNQLRQICMHFDMSYGGTKAKTINVIRNKNLTKNEIQAKIDTTQKYFVICRGGTNNHFYYTDDVNYNKTECPKCNKTTYRDGFYNDFYEQQNQVT